MTERITDSITLSLDSVLQLVLQAVLQLVFLEREIEARRGLRPFLCYSAKRRLSFLSVLALDSHCRIARVFDMMEPGADRGNLLEPSVLRLRDQSLVA